MVFSNIQAYLDPSHWQQQLNSQIGIGGTSGGNPHLPPPQQPQALPPPQSHGMAGLGSPGSIRPGSMSDRARMANIPMPEVALKCPRCESTNTKFCYFNNYSLSQPRHFCKTCRRYWTRGGALRSVPVGGGCRRNKRSKGGGSSSKSPVSGSDLQNSSSSTSSVSLTSTSAHPGGSILGMNSQLHLPPLRFMSPLGQLTPFSSGDSPGLNYMSAPSVVTSDQMNFQTMGSQLGGGYMAEQWRMQAAQISSLAGLDLASNLYPFQGIQGINLEASSYVNEGGLFRPKNMMSSGLSTQMASVKMEDNIHNNNNQEMNLPRQFLGMQGNDIHQYWGGTTSSANWTDLSGFSSSSTTNPL